MLYIFKHKHKTGKIVLNYFLSTALLLLNTMNSGSCVTFRIQFQYK
jgi:hypothetical protein